MINNGPFVKHIMLRNLGKFQFTYVYPFDFKSWIILNTIVHYNVLMFCRWLTMFIELYNRNIPKDIPTLIQRER